VQRGVRGDDRASLAAEQVTRILRREDQAAVVLADPPGQGDHEAAHRGVLEQQPELVDDEEPAAVAALDPGPERFRQQIVDRGDHLRSQLAHAEDDQRRVQVEIGRPAEDLAEAASHPPGQNTARPRLRRQPEGDVPEHGDRHRLEGLPHRQLQQGSLRLVQLAADDAAEIDRVGDGGTHAGLVPRRAPQVEDVECVAGAEREVDVQAAQPAGEAAVLVLGIDDEHLRANAEGSHGERRQQVRLAGAGVAEDADVGVRVAAVVEGIDEDGLTGRPVAAQDQAGGLLEVGVEPREEGGEGGRVEEPAAPQRVACDRERRDPAVELPAGRGQELAESGAGGRLDQLRPGLQLRRGGGRQGEIGGHLEGALLTRREPSLQQLGGRRRALDQRVADSVRAVHLGGPHLDELPLQVVDHPGGRQPFRVPGEGHAQPQRDQPPQPSRRQVPAGESFEPPGAVPAQAVRNGARRLGAEQRAGERLPLQPPDVGRRQVAQRPFHPVESRQRRREEHVATLCDGGVPDRLGEGQVPLTPLGRRRHPGVHLLDGIGSRAGNEVDEDLEGRVQAVQQGPEAGDPAAAVVLGGVEVADRAGGQHPGRRPAQLGQLPGWTGMHEQRAHAAGGRSDAVPSSSAGAGDRLGRALMAERRTITAGEPPLDRRARRRARGMPSR
jgi:hypothetical protein